MLQEKRNEKKRWGETRVWDLLGIIKNFPTWQNVNNQEHILSKAILEMGSKVILFSKKMKYNNFIFSLLFSGTLTHSLHNTNYAILLDCTPNLKLTEFQVPQVYPQVIFPGRQYAWRNSEPLMTIYFWRNLTFDSLLRLSWYQPISYRDSSKPFQRPNVGWQHCFASCIHWNR